MGTGYSPYGFFTSMNAIRFKIGLGGNLPVLVRSNLVYLSCAILGAAFLMLSCASSSRPEQLIIHVPSRFAGKIHLDTCISGAPAVDVSVDSSGLGKTSLCPAANHSVELQIIVPDRKYNLSASEVHILRTGDGLATSIEAECRK